MATINFGNTVTLKQAAQLIMAVPNNVFLLEGEPGIGKSSLMKVFEQEYGDAYNYVYFDCANKDLGDIAMPMPNRDTRETEYYPNAVFKMRSGKPMVIMLDEYPKGAQPVQNMLHTTFEVLNPRLGDIPVPKGSRVFITGNLSSDGVGDNIKGHTLNRVTRVRVSKPTAEEWLMWAAENGIDPVMMAWVDQYPHCMESYTSTGQDTNPYIYNPKRMQQSYFSPRSAERGSNIIKARHMFSPDALICALAGTIGESAARDIQAFIEYQDQLPSKAEIISDPSKAKLPTTSGAAAVMTYTMITMADKDSINPFMDYLERLAPEWQATFCLSLAKDTKKQNLAFKCKKLSDWVAKNEDLL